MIAVHQQIIDQLTSNRDGLLSNLNDIDDQIAQLQASRDEQETRAADIDAILAQLEAEQ